MEKTGFDTPALILDMDAVERNISRMAEYFRGKKAALRPHVKVHKSPVLAQKQIAAGAKGITVAKVSEAGAMARAGIDDILIANEIPGDDKVRRLAKLAKECSVHVLVDDPENAKQISNLAAQEGSKIGILVEINLGRSLDGILDRCGVPPGAQAVALAREITKLRNLEFRGVMGYEGALRKFGDVKEKRVAAEKALGLLVDTKDQIEDAGVDVPTVSCGGTMSYNIAGDFPGVTEVQAGSYVFMDATYLRYGIDFEVALTLLTSVVSRPRPNKIIVDAGYKAISADHGLPILKNRTDMEVIALNAEHGHISSHRPELKVERAEKLELLTTHVDTTVCLHDDYVVTRKGVVQGTLNIACRGKLQ